MGHLRRRLLLLPGGLLLGHLLEGPVAGRADTWSGGLLGALVCLGLPLALWSITAAVLDGWNGRTDRTRSTTLAGQQVLAFLVAGLGEQVLAGRAPAEVLAHRGFWLGLLLHAAVGVAGWAVLRIAAAAGGTVWRWLRGRGRALSSVAPPHPGHPHPWALPAAARWASTQTRAPPGRLLHP